MPTIVVNRTRHLRASVVDVPKRLHSDKIIAVQYGATDVRTFQMLGWIASEIIDLAVQCLNRSNFGVGHLVVGNDQEIDVAIEVKIARRERTYKVRSDKVLPKCALSVRGESLENEREFRIGFAWNRSHSAVYCSNWVGVIPSRNCCRFPGEENIRRFA